MRLKKPVLVAVAVGLVGALGAAGYAVTNATSSSSSAPAQSSTSEGPVRAALPDRVAVSGPDGNWIGYGDSDALLGHPDFAASPKDPEAAQDAWLRELVPVTKTQDPQSELIGYYVQTVGFVDLATRNSPDFDLDRLLADAEAAQDRLSQEWNQANGVG